ncbi:MAG: alpha/beta hydrolase [Chitinophaga sp.]|uniref:alpha/beta fold hydrolase n=1 Tax=Chitinophaga sp. TaxID=1869181 RepID=UPI001B1627F4|nr:alpha/beta hydrolase [Chitinophaga sp.]MBO9730964.1 alpha/beta hydrolase [Chitinophaga sp.]
MILLKKWWSRIIVLLLTALLLGFLFIKNGQETAELNEAARKQAPGHFIQLDHGLVHYQLLGPDSAKLLVLIHGGGTSGMEVWRYNIPYLLSKGYRILAYDLYGRGYSDRPDVVYNLDLYRQQLVQLLDTLHLQQPFDMIAMSMGAPIGLDYAGNHPDRVKHIVLLGPAASGDLQASKLLRIPVISYVLMTTYWYPRSVENQRKEFVNQPLFNSYSERLKYFMNFKGYKRLTHSGWMNMLNQNQLYLLKQIGPEKILLLYGKQDPFFPVEKLASYKTLYPTLAVQAIDSAGHMPHYEQPQLVNELMWEYIKTTP